MLLPEPVGRRLGGAIRPARRRRSAVPAASRAARAARHDQRGARRLPVQGAGRRDVRPRRSAAPVLCAVLRGDQPHHVRPADVLEPRRARALRPGATTSTPSVALLVGSARRAWSRRGSAACSSRAAASRCSAARCSAPATSCSTRRLPADEKRAAKSIIDVAFDRLGDAIGGGLVRLSMVLAPAAQTPAILSLAAACSAVAIFAASRLNRGYIGPLREQPDPESRRPRRPAPTRPATAARAS